MNRIKTLYTYLFIERLCSKFNHIIIVLLLFINCNTFLEKQERSLVLENTSKDIRLLIVPFQIQYSKDYSWIGVGLTESISTELSKIPNVISFTQEDRTRALSEISNGQRGIINDTTITNAGSFIGANYILTGKINIVQSKINIFVKIINVEKGYTVKSFKVDSSLNNIEIYKIQDQIMNNLIEDFDEREYSGSYFSERPGSTAFENYSKGLEIKNLDPKKSSSYLKKSIENYPNYLSAIKELVKVNNSFKNYKDNISNFDKYNSLINDNNLKNSRNHVELLYIEGETYYNKQDYETSLNKLYEAEKILKKTNTLQDSQLYASVMFLTGQVYQKINKRSSALEKLSISKKILEKNLFTKTKFYSEVKTMIKDLNKSNVIVENIVSTDKNAEEYINIGLDFYSKEKADIGRPYIIKGINIYKTQGDTQNVEKYELILQNLDNKTKF
jgi:TolB-like protein